MPIAVIRYDLRAAPFSPVSHAGLYSACLDQCAYAEDHGFGLVSLAEHHGTDDGFLPAPVTMAAAIAGRTKRIAITVAALLPPLHDPVRLAEQIAVADIASGGRIAYVLGAGYKREDFAMAGVDAAARGRLLEEAVDVMRRCWTGEAFEWHGRTIRVTPTPVSQPHPMLMIGGSSVAAARRAARLGLGFLPAVADEQLAAAYEEARGAAGTSGFCMMPSGPGCIFVAADPDEAWTRIGPYALHDAQTYRSWQTKDVRSHVVSGGDDVAALRAEGVYRILTPDECVALAGTLGPAGSLIMHPLLAGLPPEWGFESLELMATKVLPRLGS